ncbi:MAG: rhodanese-like domain-containing protein [Coriobacteriia bacterium]|nr:rhodanese-like domain-containing protein [Coriobacteriia bacterium]
MTRPKWIILALVIVVGIGAAVALSSGDPAPGLIGNAELRALQAGGVRVVDVRTAAEYAGGYIPGAENVPMSNLEVAARGWDPAAPTALYCATGNRSETAANTLRALGFEAVYDLAGGIAAWDGEMAGGATMAASAATPSASGLPVMYEFYTDW